MGDRQPLSPAELRVLGALMEKEILTPDLYPLSLNALQAACNQRSSREPVLDLAEADLLQALDALEHLGLAARARSGLGSAGSRVAKFENHARSILALRRDEFALVCLLLLRGPQTPGELRSRADRLFAFPDLDGVTAALQRLAATDAPARPLVVQLARQPGAREARFAHLLGDSIAPAPPDRPSSHDAHDVPLAAQLLQLQATVDDLRQRVSTLEHSIRPPSRDAPNPEAGNTHPSPEP